MFNLLLQFTSIKNTIIISALVFAFALLFCTRLHFKLLAASSPEGNTSYFKDLVSGWQALRTNKNILILILPFALTYFMNIICWFTLLCHQILKQ